MKPVLAIVLAAAALLGAAAVAHQPKAKSAVTDGGDPIPMCQPDIPNCH